MKSNGPMSMYKQWKLDPIVSMYCANQRGTILFNIDGEFGGQQRSKWRNRLAEEYISEQTAEDRHGYQNTDEAQIGGRRHQKSAQ